MFPTRMSLSRSRGRGTAGRVDRGSRRMCLVRSLEGGKLVRFSPAGEKVAEYAFPMRQVTGVAFGGEDLRDLFVSTANYPWNDGEYQTHHAGAVFRMKESPYTGNLEFLR